MDQQKIKVAFVIHGLVMGGAEKFLLNLINLLPRFRYSPHLILLSKDNILLHELKNDIPIIIFERRRKFDLSVTRKIRKYLSDNGISCVFCINTFSFFLSKGIFSFNTNIKYFLSVHSTIPPTIKNYFQNLLYYRALSSRDRIIYLCHAQHVFLEKTYLFSNRNSIIINNGIDTSYFNPSHFSISHRTQFRNELGFTKKDKLIIMVARINPEKGHADAIRALNLVDINRFGPVHLIFIGGGKSNEIQTLKLLAKKANVEARVHFLGEQMDVRPYLNIADFFTLTSHSTETFSLSALEAMAFGLPCSLTDIGGASEMIKEGLNGVVSAAKNPVSIAQSWECILSAEYSRDNIRAYIIDNFSVLSMIENYDCFLNSSLLSK